MTIRRLFSCSNSLFFALAAVVLFFPMLSWGQDASQNQSAYKEGRITEALFASVTPDSQTVGVYLVVGQENEVSPQEWATTIEKYFTAYGFPVKIILYHKHLEGTGAVARIYIAGKAYQGNLSNGNIGLSHLLTEHAKVFPELLNMYKEANPDLFTAEE